MCARLAEYTDVSYSPSHDATRKKHEDEDAREIDQLQSCFASRIQASKTSSTSSHHQQPPKDEEEEEFPMCFYAQMLGNSADYHESISARATPRQPPKQRVSVLELEGEDAAFKYFGSKMATNLRNQKYGSGAAEGVYPSALIEHCDPAVIAKAQQCAAEINDLIKHVGRRNQVSEAARVQLMRSRCVSQMIPSSPPAGTNE